ncbi:MAG TPA: hypothetical protein VFA33_05010 [Bryobacteraceae bacterium]|nr:hypothetical protein [Bryobacteraceae bacterium]
MDVLENILERISETQEQREVYLRQAEAEEQKIAKLEQMYYLLEDPATQELMKDVVVGMAVQNGVPVPNGNKGDAGEKHYVGMQRVREYVTAMPANREFTVHDVFTKSIEHMPSTPKIRHPEFEKQRKASISLALTSMAKAGDIEVVKQGRGREATVYRKQEGK